MRHHIKYVDHPEEPNKIGLFNRTGSRPVLTTNCLHSSTDRTSGYGLEDRGSNPLGDTKKSLIVISKVCNDINIVG